MQQTALFFANSFNRRILVSINRTAKDISEMQQMALSFAVSFN
jgi:hypothetical protein